VLGTQGTAPSKRPDTPNQLQMLSFWPETTAQFPAFISCVIYFAQCDEMKAASSQGIPSL
jgi:hypothetical protein